VGPFQRGRGGPGGWLILDEPELHFGGDVVVPDLAGWRVEQPPELEATFFTVVPAWVCEVLSPSSSAVDRGPKSDLYARVGVQYYWLIEPLDNQSRPFACSRMTPGYGSAHGPVKQ
jgi:Uma2 family endonuclease